MEKRCCDIVQSEMVKLADIHPNKGQIPGVPRNPRFIRDGKYALLKKSIEEDPEMMGLREILLYRCNGELVIIGGNMRFRALKELGYAEVAVKIIKDDTPSEKLRRIVLKDNSGFGEWDFESLANEWDAADIAVSAIDIPEIGDVKMEEEDAEEDNFPVDDNIPEEPTSELGDIYALGNHRLMCGDSTRSEDVEALMGGQQADALVTDPPYNVNYGYARARSNAMKATHGDRVKDVAAIENDAMSEDAFANFLESAFTNAARALKPGGAFYVWHASSQIVPFRQSLEKCGLGVRQCLEWVKNHFSLGLQDYQNQLEPCLYGWKNGAAHYFCGKRNLATIIEKLQDRDLTKSTKEELLALLDEISGLPTNGLREKKPLSSDLHPTMKPIKLMAQNIKASTRKGERVLDLFGGSGSTLMAAEQTGRVCYMMEYAPKYVGVIIKRWEEYTGEKARKLGNARMQNNTEKKRE